MEEMVATFPSRVRSAADAEDALDVYRSELSEAKDGSVVIVSLGHATNLLSLLLSEGDAWSPLSGPELVRTKVQHMVMSESSLNHYAPLRPTP